MKKANTSQRAPKATPSQAFQKAADKVFAVHGTLFRRLAEYDRQKNGRNK